LDWKDQTKTMKKSRFTEIQIVAILNKPMAE